MSVSLQEVAEMECRLEGNFYGSKGREARRGLEKCKWPIVRLDDGFVKNAYYLGRFKRIYVDESSGIPFLLPSQITDIYPKAVRFLSPKTNIDTNKTRVKRGQVLLTRSGTIGAVSYVSETLHNQSVSDDVIRIELKECPGYVYAYFKSETGRSLIETNNYGAVVKHIEPHHLDNVLIPDPPPILKHEIHNLIEHSFRLRDESNDLLDEAQAILKEALSLPDMQTLKSRAKAFDDAVDFTNWSVPLSGLDERADGSYHIPLISVIEDHLNGYAKEVTRVGDDRVSQSIVLPGRFKRHYVDEDNGIVFFGGKQLYELDPSNKKYLSRMKHSDRVRNDLEIRTNTILITRSGTIGKVTIAPEHWNNWIPNEHIVRLFPATDEIAGYLFAWLSSEYAFPLITRYTYGAVVDEIDNKQVSQVSVPLLQNEATQRKINDMVLEANAKRTEAYDLEQEALKLLNEKVIYAE